jgi:hypothetical protein
VPREWSANPGVFVSEIPRVRIAVQPALFKHALTLPQPKTAELS